MILKCPCGHQFVPWVRESCPMCGGDSGIERVEGWVRYLCGCGHLAYRGLGELTSATCPVCGAHMSEATPGEVVRERPDFARAERLPGGEVWKADLMVRAAACVLYLRGGLLLLGGIVLLVAASRVAPILDVASMGLVPLFGGYLCAEARNLTRRRPVPARFLALIHALVTVGVLSALFQAATRLYRSSAPIPVHDAWLLLCLLPDPIIVWTLLRGPYDRAIFGGEPGDPLTPFSSLVDHLSAPGASAILVLVILTLLGAAALVVAAALAALA